MSECPNPWSRPATARYYEVFCRAHTRYQEANAQLITAAQILPGQRVLDLGAGTGRTAEAALGCLGEGAITCVEPSEPMRRAGMERLRDGRVEWREEIPEGRFERILWGAGIWQAAPLGTLFKDLAERLNPGGLLAFTIPALYLRIPDDPGGGPDPLLLHLPARLQSHSCPASDPSGPSDLPDPDGLAHSLKAAGLDPQASAFQIRITQECQRDWLKIPVMTDRLMPAIAPDERARRIDDAYKDLEPGSWKWENWQVWTAAKPSLTSI